MAEVCDGSEDREEGPEDGQSEVGDSWLASDDDDGLSLEPLEETEGTG